MVLIIACHILQYYNNELCQWLNVGVQIFFVISGYLYGRKEISDPIGFIAKNFKKILVPYYTFLFSAITLYAIFAPDFLNAISIFKSLFCAGTIKGLGHLWFIGYILFCYLLSPYLYWVRIKTQYFSFKKTIGVYSVLLLSVQVIGCAFDSYFIPDRISCYIIGFFIPSLIEKTAGVCSYRIAWSFCTLAVVMNCFRIYVKYIAVGFMPDSMTNIIVRYSHMMLGVSLFIVLYRMMKHIQYNGLLKWSDKYSYSVYLVHLLFILSPFSLMAVTTTPLLNWMLVIVATMVSALCLQTITYKLLYNE